MFCKKKKASFAQLAAVTVTAFLGLQHPVPLYSDSIGTGLQ